MKIGLLALQGAVEPHAASLARLGVASFEIRRPGDLADADALILPGGESTTISILLERQGLFESLAERLAGGLPVLGTCAGMILLGSEIIGGRSDQRCLGVIDISVRRNAFGRQVDSFEAEIQVDGFSEAGLDPAPFHGVFIRAPVVERVGGSVEVLARVGGAPVLCRQGSALASSFHPELTADTRVHELLLHMTKRDPASHL